MKSSQQILYLMCKTKSFSSKFRNKTRVPTFTTPIEHNTGGSSQGSYARNRNKRHPNHEGRSKIISVPK